MGTTSNDSYFFGLRARLRTRITAVVATIAMVASGGALVLAPSTARASSSLPLLDGVQMDGDTAVQLPATGTSPLWNATVDWASLLASPPCTNNFTGVNANSPQPVCTEKDRIWIRDAYSTSGQDDAFTLGSKDIYDPYTGTSEAWSWVNFQTPDKNDLTDVFGHVKDNNLYVGALRYATNGSAYIGFWLFKRAIASKCFNAATSARMFVDSKPGAVPRPGESYINCVADPGNPGSFVGTAVPLHHADGDFLVLINYENGGSTTTNAVYRWPDMTTPFIQGNDCSDVTGGPGSTDVCSVTNGASTVTVPSSWNYTPKSGAQNVVQKGGFFEAAIDLDAVLPGRDACFSSIIGETRSSSSISAETKDFAGGKFTPCSIQVDKTGPSIGKVGADPGDLLNYTVTVTNDGEVTLYRKSINDSIAGNLLGTPNAGISNVVNNCGSSLAPGASCTITYSYQAKNTDPDPLPNTVTVVYNAASDLSGSDVSGSDGHSVNLFQPGVSIDKTCDTLSKVGDPYTCTVTVTNSGSADSPASVFDTLTDSKAGNLLGTPNVGTTITSNTCKNAGIPVQLLPGGSCSVAYDRITLITDSDPIVNTATVHMHPSGFPNDLTDDDQASINLFQPSVLVTKTCDPLSKVTDPLNCTVTVRNNGSADSPNLVFDQNPALGLVDSVVGDLLGPVGALPIRGTKLDTSTCFRATSLAVNATCKVDYVFTVLVSDPDPLVNVVSTLMHPVGFPNNITDDDTATTNLFQPAIAVAKSCDDLSKVGDDAYCTVTVTNSGSADSPNLILDSVSDTVVGNLNGSLSRGSKTSCPTFPGGGLAPGATWTCTYKFTVVVGDPDPIVNTVTVHTHPSGFPNDIWGSDSESINLFQPSVLVDKVANTTKSMIGATVRYTVTVTNNGSADSPNLVFDQDPTKGLVDTRAGDLLRTLNAGYTLVSRTCLPATSLAVSGSCAVVYDHVILAGDPDPLTNVAGAWMHPVGFPNDIKDDDDATVNLFQPSIDIVKTCDDLSKIGDDVECSVTATNTSSADSPNLILDTILDTLVGNLNGTLTRGVKLSCPAFPVGGLAPAATWTCSYKFTVLVTDTDPEPGNPNVDLENTVIVHTHPANVGSASFSAFDVTDSDSEPINLFQPSVIVDKSGNTSSATVGQTVRYTVTVTNNGSADSPNLVFDQDPTKGLVDSRAGDLLRTLNAGYTLVSRTCLPATSLAVSGSCTVVYDHVVVIGDPDPITNVARAWMHPVGFPNDIKDDDDHTVNLFQFGITIDKTCDPLSKVGDDVDCNVTVTNTSSADSPNLVLDSVSDTVVGNLNGTLTRGTKVTCPTFPVGGLAPAASWTCHYRFTVLVGDPDPIVNTVTVHTHPSGRADDIYGSDSASINLFQPSLSVDKTVVVTTPVNSGGLAAGKTVVGDTLTYTVTVTNTGSADSPNLVFDQDPTKGLVDSKAGDLLRTLGAGYTLVSRTCLPATSLAVNGSCTVVFTHVVTSGDPDPLTNRASAWMHPVGFPNDIKGYRDASIDIVHPDFSIAKQCISGQVPLGGTAIFDITITNTGDVEIPANSIVVSDPRAISAKWATSTITFPFTIPVAIPVSGSVQITDVTEAVTAVNLGPDGSVVNSVSGSLTYYGRTPIVREAQASCPVPADGATRTPGFWQTHVSYTTHIFRDALGSRIDLGWRVLTTKEQVFGMFWASNARESDGTRRDSVCQARVIGSFQLLAAILNTGLSNGAPVPIDAVTGKSIIVAMREALAAGNVQEIKRLQGLLDTYNNHGDAVAIVDNWGVSPGNASPTTAKQLAATSIADC